MTTPNEPIRCPKCGAAMNRHAEKIDTRVPTDSPDGGALVEVHTCPACQYVAERRTDLPSAPLS